MKIERTVIGSFPRQVRTPNYSLDESIKDVVDLQLAYGVNIVTDGEQREDLIGYFEQIPGLEKVGKRLEIGGKIEPMYNVDDFYKIVDYHTVRSYLISQNRRDTKIKIPLTGPITLGVTSAISGIEHYENILDQQLYSDCIEALVPLAKRILDIGAHLQIDEPGLSAGYTSPKIAGKILKDFVSHIPDSAIDEGRVNIHVCGAIRDSLYEELLSLDIGILSLAFSGINERGNIDIVSKKSLEENGKKLAVGFISNVVLEGKGIAKERLFKVAKKVGRENIAHVHPDCGFGGTDPILVEPILENMEKASNDFIWSE